jgi:MFS family permease
LRARGPLLAFFAFGAFWGAWGVLLPDVKEDVGASVSQLGVALLALGLAALPAMLVAGRIVDRVGPRATPWALVLFAIAGVLPAFAGSVPELAFALLLLGAATGALDVVINSAATSVEVATGRRIIQVAHALFSGGFLAGAIGTGIARGLGAEPFPVLAGVATLAAVAAGVNRGFPAVPRRVSERHVSFSRRLIVLGVLCGVAFVVEGGIENWSALFLEAELDASPALAALGPGLFAAAMVTGRLLGQWLEVRLGDRLLFVGGTATAGGGLVLAAIAPDLPLALVGFAVGGAGISVAAPIVFGAAGSGADDEERGSAVASVTTISYLGFVAGPPLVGAVSGTLDLRAGLGLLAAIALLLSLAAASFGGDALSVRRLQHPSRG